MVALVLPPRAAEVYRNADQYLPLFVLIVLFLFGGPLIAIVNSLTDSLCRLLVRIPLSAAVAPGRTRGPRYHRPSTRPLPHPTAARAC